MPSDILSVRVTTEVVAEKAGEEPTLAVQVIVDKRVPVLGWVLMVSALFGLAAMVSGSGSGRGSWKWYVVDGVWLLRVKGNSKIVAYAHAGWVREAAAVVLEKGARAGGRG